MSIILNPNGLNSGGGSGGGGATTDIPNASTGQAGKVQLSNAINSDSQTMASTPLAVKTVLTESKNYTDNAIANLNIQDVINNLNIQDIIDNINDHESSLINTEQGLHGVRIWKGKLQQTNNNGAGWTDVASNVNIVDDLNSTDSKSALSANQGNAIKLLIEKLQSDLTNNENKIANETEYGYVKIDNDTLKYNVDGQLYVDIDTNIDVNTDVDWSAVQNKPTSLVTDIDDAVVKKHEHVNKDVLNKLSEDENGKLLYDGLTIASSNITSVNGKLPDTNGNIEINIPTVQDGNLSQKGIVQLSNDISENDTLSSTPKAVFNALAEAKEYADMLIDNLESTLEKYSFELLPTVQGQLEFDMPAIYNQNPEYYIELLYFNSTKVLESKYLITEKVTGDKTQGYKLVLLSPAPDYTSAIYNLILIGGKALSTGSASNSTVTSINNISPDATGNVQIPQASSIVQGVTYLTDVIDDTDNKAVTPKAVKDYVDSLNTYFHTGDTPPTNTNLIWYKI